MLSSILGGDRTMSASKLLAWPSFDKAEDASSTAVSRRGGGISLSRLILTCVSEAFRLAAGGGVIGLFAGRVAACAWGEKGLIGGYSEGVQDRQACATLALTRWLTGDDFPG